MKFVKSFKSYLESIQIDIKLIEIDINESLGLFYDSVMKSIGAEEVDFYDTFKLSKDEFSDKMNLDLLTTNPEFIKSLSGFGFKKSNSPILLILKFRILSFIIDFLKYLY